MSNRSRSDTKYYYGDETLSQFCHRTGSSYASIRHRMDARGLSVEEAVAEYKEDIKDGRPRHCHQQLWVLKDGRPLSVACRVECVRYNSVLDRMEEGMDINVAFAMTKARKGNHACHAKYWYKGETMAEICRKTGISYGVAAKRIREEGYTVEEAIKELRGNNE